MMEDLKLTKREDERSPVASLDPHTYSYMGIFCTSCTMTLLCSHIFLIWKETLIPDLPYKEKSLLPRDLGSLLATI